MKTLKISVVLLCALLCLSACGSKSSETEPVDDTPVEVIDDTPAPAKELTRGTVNGQTYKNESIGLSCTLPEGWRFYSDEEIAQINNMSREAFEGTNIEEYLKNDNQLTDMFAQDPNDLSNINVIITSGGSSMEGYTDEFIFTMMKEFYLQQFEGSGLNINNYEVKKTTLNGEEKTYLEMDVEMEGISFKEYQFYVRNGGEYVATVTLTMVNQKPFDEIITWFNY